jgi:raffinose/stachyose/melibiose transport system substrate-binding protein
MRKLALVVVALLVLSALGYAAGGAEGAKGVKLVYWTQAQEGHKPMVDAFVKANPNIQIEQVDMPAVEQRQVIIPALASGTGPDVFYFELGAADVDPLIKANLIVDLEEPNKKYGWKNKLTAFATAEATHYGKLWAIPNESEFIATFYNKDIFAQYGVKEPATGDDFVAILEKIRKDGKVEPLAFGVADKWAALHRISLGYQWGPGGAAAVSKALFEGASFDTPDFAKGMALLQGLDRNYMPNNLDRKMDAALAQFWSGKAAMVQTGTWNISGALKSDIGSKVDFFVPATPGTNKPNTVAGCGGGWYVYAKSKAIAECLTFLDFTLSKESTDIWFGQNYLPPIPIKAGASSAPAMINKAIQNIEAVPMGYFIHHFVSTPNREWIQDGYQLLVAGKVTPAQYVKEFDRIAQKAKAEGFRP